MGIRKQATALFCVLIFCYLSVHQELDWNQNSRLDLLHALVVYRTFKIDAYHENTGDKSVHDGHYYSEKAPGVVFLALPAFALSALVLSYARIPLDSDQGWYVSGWIATGGSVSIVTALGGVAMFLFLSRLLTQRVALLTTIVVFLGAAPFPYGTMLFSHAAVIGLICIALWAVADEDFVQKSRNVRNGIPRNVGTREEPRPGHAGPASTRAARMLLAGVCSGMAISSEYTAAVAAGGVLALALLTSLKRGVVLALGALPALLLIPVYNFLCFGGPLAFGYHHLALLDFQRMNEGFFGITWPPNLKATYLILISPARGLFFWTPFFLMTFYGLKPLFQASRRLLWTMCVVVLVQIVCISGYYMPDGGSALGPRHLAPMLPFLAIAAAFGLQTEWSVGTFYGFASIVMTGGATLIMAMPNRADTIGLLYTRAMDGRFTHTLGNALGLPMWAGAAFVFAFMCVVYAFTCFQRAEGSEVSVPSTLNRQMSTAAP